jgi:hypothetical protein
MSKAHYEPRNTDPPHIPNADIYDTHRPGEWIAITDVVYSDVVRGTLLDDYSLSFVALPTGNLWVHIETAWQETTREPVTPKDSTP